jgi:hypothetical protein
VLKAIKAVRKGLSDNMANNSFSDFAMDMKKRFRKIHLVAYYFAQFSAIVLSEA